MSDQTPPSAADGDAVWTAAARHLAGEGTAEEREAFRREAAAHPGREALLAALDDALQPLTDDARPDVDVEAALAAVLARRDAGPRLVAEPREEGVREIAPPPSTVRPERWRMPVWLPAAALMVAMIGAALLWRRSSGPGVVEAAQSYSTGIGATRDITLPDGSVVHLGPESRLGVPGGYGRDERGVRMAGEAYFEVRHDAAHPFVVRTAAVEVRDLGTTFTVRTEGYTGARVAVTSGSVSLKSAKGGREVVLRAGDRGSLDSGAVKVERGTATDDDVAWTRGRLVFRDATVPEVAAELRRWYGITLVVRDPELASRHLTASFGSESADEAVAVVAAALGGQLQRRGDTAAVVPRGP